MSWWQTALDPANLFGKDSKTKKGVRNLFADPQSDVDKRNRLTTVGGNVGVLADDAHLSYQGLNGRLNGALDDLQARANGQNSVSALQLHQALQQNLASQRANAASASPGNAAMAARTAANNMGRLGYGLAGQQAVAGLQERNQAQDAYSGLLGMSRGQDLQGAIGAYNTQVSAYGGNQQQEPGKTKMDKLAPAIMGAAMAMSDRRAKSHIEPGDVKANQALNGLSAYSYRYKDQEHGAGPQLGVMAQDLERVGLSSAVIDTPQGKMVDGAKLAGANTAMLAALGDRVEDLEKRPYRGGLNGHSK